MAVAAWIFYNEAKKYLMNGTIDLDTDVFKVSLHTSASNASTATLSTYASVNNEVANANNYATGGKSMTAITWASGASASEYRWDATALVWTASGGSISAVKFAVARNSAGKLMAWSKLSTSQFSVTTGNTLTLTPSANGIFELN